MSPDYRNMLLGRVSNTQALTLVLFLFLCCPPAGVLRYHTLYESSMLNNSCGYMTQWRNLTHPHEPFCPREEVLGGQIGHRHIIMSRWFVGWQTLMIVPLWHHVLNCEPFLNRSVLSLIQELAGGFLLPRKEVFLTYVAEFLVRGIKCIHRDALS